VSDQKNVIPSEGGSSETIRSEMRKGAFKRRFNIVATILGLLGYLAAFQGGETLIIKSVVEPHPEFNRMLEDLEKGELEPLPDEEKKRLRGIVFGDPVFVGVGLSIVLVIPLIIGAAITVFSRGLREAIAALALGAIYIATADAGMLEILLVMLPLNVGLAAGGGWLGLKISRNNGRR
jgi:hypothetical protein